MRYFLALILLSSTALAGECALTARLSSGAYLETSFSASTPEECGALAEKANANRFYGLVDKQESLIEIESKYKAHDEEILQVSF